MDNLASTGKFQDYYPNLIAEFQLDSRAEYTYLDFITGLIKVKFYLASSLHS